MQYNAFKVPANIYDPNAYKTDGSGNTISDKGVWLASYEFKMFFTNEGSFFRATGFNLGTTSKNTVIIPETLPFNLFSETDGNTNLTVGSTGITITYLSTQESYQNNFDLTNNIEKFRYVLLSMIWFMVRLIPRFGSRATSATAGAQNVMPRVNIP